MTGNELRRIRIARKMSQSDMARSLGISRYQTVLEYERGKRPVPQYVVIICRLRGWLRKGGKGKT